MAEAVTFEVTHSEAGVRRAVRVLWSSRYRKAWWTSMGVAVALMTAALATRELPWYLAIPLTAVILHAAFLAWNRDRVMALMAQQLERAQPPVFRYRLDDAGLAESSAVGDATLPWSSFAALREADGFLFILRAPLEGGMFIALPAEQVPEAARALLRERLAPA
jgi:hypothetical protein